MTIISAKGLAMGSYRLLLLTITIFCFTVIPLLSLPRHVAGKDGHISGTSQDPLVVPKTESKIRIDGTLDEGAWQGALMLELRYEVRPGENVTPPVRTEVLLTFDVMNLYAAFRCHDPNPKAIRAHFRDRDTVGGDDWVGLVLDTFNDERRSLVFIVTAKGVQFDMIETQSGGDNGWDAIWNAASKIIDSGYTVEIAIPFSSFRFQRRKGPQVWGFDAVRSYPREHTHHIGLFPRNRSNNCYLCQAVKIQGFEDASPGRNIEIDPTIIATHSDERSDFPHGELAKRDQKAAFGLTARWGLTPNLTAHFTVNPDFTQVEADALQLDINEPFALSYAEKRPFFTEGADFFEALENIIYSRTIREPSWGLRLTGKDGANTIGLYAVQDKITNLVLPDSEKSNSTSLSENSIASVFRYKRDFGSKYSVGLLATNREGKDYYNRVFGFDLDFRFTPANRVQLLILGSNTEYPGEVVSSFNQPSGSFSDSLISFTYSRDTRTWDAWIDLKEAGSEFRADLGYYPKVGHRQSKGGLRYTWSAGSDSWWSSLQVGGEADYSEKQNGELLNKHVSLRFSYSGVLQSSIDIRAWEGREAYASRKFDLTYFQVEGSFWPFSNLQLGADTTFGDRIDYANARLGERLRISPWLTCNIGTHLRLSFDHTYERTTVQDERLYVANISELSANYQFNVRTLLRAIIQYVDYNYNTSNYTDSEDPIHRSFYTQLLYSYKINPRTVLFLGYNDNYFSDQDVGLTQFDRTFFIKLGYAWVL